MTQDNVTYINTNETIKNLAEKTLSSLDLMEDTLKPIKFPTRELANEAEDLKKSIWDCRQLLTRAVLDIKHGHTAHEEDAQLMAASIECTFKQWDDLKKRSANHVVDGYMKSTEPRFWSGVAWGIMTASVLWYLLV